MELINQPVEGIIFLRSFPSTSGPSSLVASFQMCTRDVRVLRPARISKTMVHLNILNFRETFDEWLISTFATNCKTQSLITLLSDFVSYNSI